MKNSKLVKNTAATKYDLADKSHHPMGGFPHYGDVKQDIVRLKVIFLFKLLLSIYVSHCSISYNLYYRDAALALRRGCSLCARACLPTPRRELWRRLILSLSTPAPSLATAGSRLLRTRQPSWVLSRRTGKSRSYCLYCLNYILNAWLIILIFQII